MSTSPEELDALMAEFPLAAFSDISVYGLVDLDASLDNVSKAISAMMGAMAQR